MTIAHVYNEHNAYKTTISSKEKVTHKLQNCLQSTVTTLSNYVIA